jgi:hypothetical protein
MIYDEFVICDVISGTVSSKGDYYQAIYINGLYGLLYTKINKNLATEWGFSLKVYSSSTEILLNHDEDRLYVQYYDRSSPRTKYIAEIDSSSGNTLNTFYRQLIAISNNL